jgi:hypothetical protein
MVLPRLLMAALLGTVIATPLVLRVFASEIEAEMRISNARDTIVLGTVRQETPDAKRLAEVKGKIAENEGILAGNLPGLTSPNVQAATDRLAKAEQDLEKKRVAADKAYLAMRCELDGYQCNGASGNKGAGPRYQALKRINDVAARDLENAEQAVTAARNALGAANEEAAATNDTKLAEAQNRARAELPGLIKERDQLQQKVNEKVGDDGKSQEGNTGLLARLEALDRLGDRSSMAELAHWAVALLFFMIELLPVLVKVLNSMGRPSLYDRISELEENSSFDDALLERNNNRRHIEGHSKKQREIEEDMRKRETALGIKANAHVASEMETILDVALRQWSVNVTNTLHSTPQGQSTSGGTPTTPTTAGQPGQAGQPNPAEKTIRNNFNIPTGSNL